MRRGDIISDHSVRSYLEKQTTEQLEGMLQYYLKEENYANYTYSILEILDILNDRFTPDATSEEVLLLRARLLQNKTKDDSL